MAHTVIRVKIYTRYLLAMPFKENTNPKLCDEGNAEKIVLLWNCDDVGRREPISGFLTP